MNETESKFVYHTYIHMGTGDLVSVHKHLPESDTEFVLFKPEVNDKDDECIKRMKKMIFVKTYKLIYS